MFPDPPQSPAANKKEAPNPSRNILIAAIAVAICLAAVTVVLFVKYQSLSSNVVPSNITQQVKFPIYIPAKLPGSYKIDPGSFTYSETDKVLIFQAKDGVGGNLVFSQQEKPKDFNFTGFHQSEIKEPKTLSDVPYPSVWGKSSDGRQILSIVTDDAWIIMNTGTNLDDNGVLAVAKNIRKQ